MSDQGAGEGPSECTVSGFDEHSLTIEEAYTLPQFGGCPYAFTRIDAVYIWTQGGYQVSRNPTDYPLFVAVHEDDVHAWRAFFKAYGLQTVRERPPSDEIDDRIYVVLEPRVELDVEFVEDYPVIPFDETVAYMREHSFHFQPAIAMLEEMYPDRFE